MCNSDFETDQESRIFCNKSCSSKYRATIKNVEKICSVCGINYLSNKSVKHYFCSKQCEEKDKNSLIEKTCVHCKKTFVTEKLKKRTRFCSVKCAVDNNDPKEPNVTCDHCGKVFYIKPSRIKKYKQRTLGFFCSIKCTSENKKIAYSGEKNPNYRGREHIDGYRIYVPGASKIHFGKQMKLHTAVCCEVLNVKGLKGFAVHHRDCNVENNIAENLVVLLASDHQWLHKQFGNATLWAYFHGKIDLESLVSWSDNKEMARTLLPLNVTIQNPNNLGKIVDGILVSKGTCDKHESEKVY